MCFMCIDRGCVGTGESKVCSFFVLTKGVLVQEKIICVNYVY